MTYTIVGLGNPGEEYSQSRHNAGRMIAEQCARAFSVSDDMWKKDKTLFGLTAKGEWEGEKVVFILPETFMNNSGKSVKKLQGSKKKIEQLIVIADELDLGLGSAKMTFNRGSGGHKGVESIIRSVKSEAFVRVKVGISPATPKGKVKKPSGDKIVHDFIIGDFKKKEIEAITAVGKDIISAIKTLITEGREKAIQQLHTKK
ncbi:MAG: aminoacyl-tRNA hydrolase [Candidatus Paceibacterota bacterium]